MISKSPQVNDGSIRPLIILVFIMFSLLTSIFPNISQAEKIKLHPHQIHLSGNIFHFSMPEDFSRDMPAADMVEALDISDPTKFNNPEYGNLIRRWWDIKKPGWFGKKLGTVMMDISVQRVFENKQQFIVTEAYDVSNRMDFMLMLNDSYHQRYDHLNERDDLEPGRSLTYSSGFLAISDEKIYSLYHDKIINGQRWMNYAVAGPRGLTLIIFALPLSKELYVEVVFTYSPNDNVSPRELGDIAHPKMALIEHSLMMSYDKENPFKNIVGKDWIEKTNTEVLEEYRGVILQYYGVATDRERLETSEKP